MMFRYGHFHGDSAQDLLTLPQQLVGDGVHVATIGVLTLASGCAELIHVFFPGQFHDLGSHIYNWLTDKNVVI